MIGINNSTRENAVGTNPGYLPSANPGMHGGNTYTATSSDPTIQDYENVFGPSARDIKQDLQRFKRHGRWHLPDVLKGPNPWLTDRIDGLITDTTDSPFTTKILPYKFKEDPDAKMKWNVWTFDEGMASRVPYETAARTLTQSKRSFSGYMVRQGMAISLEHNFMMSPKGREDFKNQLNQLIGSIQYTNDLDVHMALILAPSYEKFMRERYYTNDKSPSQVCREFVDLFGMAQKNTNALDILIEEAKAILKTWGSPMPDFMLCNSKLTFQLTMTPEKTNYITQGYDGVKRLKNGPDIASYRGLSVIHSRSFSMETGQHPRDILRRRVRTAEYYRIVPHKDNHKREFEFYNEERDTWFTLSFKDLLRMAKYEPKDDSGNNNHMLIDAAHDSIHAKSENRAMATLGAQPGFLEAFRTTRPPMKAATVEETARIDDIIDPIQTVMDRVANRDTEAINMFFSDHYSRSSRKDIHTHLWINAPFSFDMGIRQVLPHGNTNVDLVRDLSRSKSFGPSRQYLERTGPFSLALTPRINNQMEESLFHQFQALQLNHPFQNDLECSYPEPGWYMAYTFWLTVFKRYGFPLDYLEQANPHGALPPFGYTSAELMNSLLDNLTIKNEFPADDEVNLSCQMLRQYGMEGGVNDPVNMARRWDCEFLDVVNDLWAARRVDSYQFQFDHTGTVQNIGRFMASVPLLTWEVLKYIIPFYDTPQGVKQGITIIRENESTIRTGLAAALRSGYTRSRVVGASAVLTSVTTDHFAGRVDLTLKFIRAWEDVVAPLFRELKLHDARNPADALATQGINTWPMGITSMSHFLHPAATPELTSATGGRLTMFDESYGHVNKAYLMAIKNIPEHPWNAEFFPVLDTTSGAQSDVNLFDELIKTLTARVFEDARIRNIVTYREIISEGIRNRDIFAPDPANPPKGPADTMTVYLDEVRPLQTEVDFIFDAPARRRAVRRVTSVSNNNLGAVTLRYGDLFRSVPSNRVPVAPSQSTDVVSVPPAPKRGLEDIEIVIVRPNIEHTMLGIILGLGGDALGNTLWGQTELSVYDDSMYGIWGMSYKYHERAIVFNEKNLIRMWDVAYDGYNGGKDDTYVDWTKPGGANGFETFQTMTMDVSQNYHGPSMMVMAFSHDKDNTDATGQRNYDRHFRRNWPSPIVYHDSWTPGERVAEAITLPVDCDNIHVISVEEFRVFNNPLYMAYQDYKAFMPPFNELHKQRKSAGQSSVDSETPTDSLAFQGTMRIKEDGRLMQEILGSGHHGPDYIGIASVRAGKGQKVSGQAPTLHRLI